VSQLKSTPHNSSNVNTALGVHLEHIHKSFDQTCVLEDINLEITPGSFNILIGSSGCGKTTLLRILGGLEHSSQGSMSYRTRQNQPYKTTEGDLSYGFQEPRLLPWRTVFENVALPLSLRGISESEIHTVVMDSLHRVGLADAAHLLPAALSGGMKMRAAIARSLVMSPRFLLLDEPFGALDEITKNRLDDELLTLWQKLDVTIVLVTHSLAEAIYLGQTIHILSTNPGKIAHTLHIDLGERTPHTRLTTEFSQYVAQAHQLLSKAEAHSKVS
jgi:NitT/TauT family transport system ATP-binding protein